LPKECLYIKNDKEYKENIPKLLEMPDNILDADRIKIEKVESLSHREFMEKFLPLLL